MNLFSGVICIREDSRVLLSKDKNRFDIDNKLTEKAAMALAVRCLGYWHSNVLAIITTRDGECLQGAVKQSFTLAAPAYNNDECANVYPDLTALDRFLRQSRWKATGRTVDLTRLYSSVGDYLPENQWKMGDEEERAGFGFWASEEEEPLAREADEGGDENKRKRGKGRGPEMVERAAEERLLVSLAWVSRQR